MGVQRVKTWIGPLFSNAFILSIILFVNLKGGFSLHLQVFFCTPNKDHFDPI